MSMAGMIGPDIRLPMVPLADEHRPKLAEMISEFGVKV